MNVNSYIDRAPEEQRPALRVLRRMIREYLSSARESIGASGFPVYTDAQNNWLAGFATRKKCPMLYIMDAKLLDRHERRLGKLRSGKSCIDWRPTAGLSISELTLLTKEILQLLQARQDRKPSRKR